MRAAMRISIIDAGEYFRGLLLLSRRDRKISEPEAELMKRIGKTLGFEREFCDNAIREILENEYILDTPPKFSTSDLAMKFIKDGLTLAFSDKEVVAFECEWLRAAAENNGLDMQWFVQQWKLAMNTKDTDNRLEVDDLSVKYS
jgi:hypothetical protein